MIENTAGQERKADEGNISECVRVCADTAHSTLCIPPINQGDS